MAKEIRSKNGERKAYATKYRNDNGGTTYAVGHDLGNPNRSAMDREINTPVGTLGYGYDGNTDYLSYVAPYIKNFPGGAALMSGGERMGFINNNDGALTLGLDNGNPNRSVYDGGFNTPIGRVGYGYDGNTNYASLTPNHYVQALLNLLNR